MKKTLSLVGNLFFGLLVMVMIALTFFAVKSKIDNSVPQVAGYQLYTVLSGSMSPTFDTGSVVALKPLASQDVRTGDIITFKEPDDPKKYVTHRVMKVINKGGSLSFITRGDANDAADPKPVSASNLVGKVHFSIPYAGYLTSFTKSKKGLLTLIVIPGLVVLFFELRKLFQYIAQAEEEEKLKKEKLLQEEVQIKT